MGFEQDTHHVVTRKQLLQELGLFGLHRLDDELVIAGQVEPGAAGSGVGQLDKRLVTEGVLKQGRRPASRVAQPAQALTPPLSPHSPGSHLV